MEVLTEVMEDQYAIIDAVNAVEVIAAPQLHGGGIPVVGELPPGWQTRYVRSNPREYEERAPEFVSCGGSNNRYRIVYEYREGREGGHWVIIDTETIMPDGNPMILAHSDSDATRALLPIGCDFTFLASTKNSGAPSPLPIAVINATAWYNAEEKRVAAITAMYVKSSDPSVEKSMLLGGYYEKSEELSIMRGSPVFRNDGLCMYRRYNGSWCIDKLRRQSMMMESDDPLQHISSGGLADMLAHSHMQRRLEQTQRQLRRKDVRDLMMKNHPIDPIAQLEALGGSRSFSPEGRWCDPASTPITVVDKSSTWNALNEELERTENIEIRSLRGSMGDVSSEDHHIEKTESALLQVTAATGHYARTSTRREGIVFCASTPSQRGTQRVILRLTAQDADDPESRDMIGRWVVLIGNRKKEALFKSKERGLPSPIGIAFEPVARAAGIVRRDGGDNVIGPQRDATIEVVAAEDMQREEDQGLRLEDAESMTRLIDPNAFV